MPDGYTESALRSEVEFISSIIQEAVDARGGRHFCRRDIEILWRNELRGVPFYGPKPCALALRRWLPPSLQDIPAVLARSNRDNDIVDLRIVAEARRARRLPRRRPAHFLYVVGPCFEGPVKVGISNCPELRLSELQVGHHARLHLFRVLGCHDVTSARLAERFAHAWLPRLRVRRLNGEWFQTSASIAGIVARGAVRVTHGRDHEDEYQHIAKSVMRLRASASARDAGPPVAAPFSALWG